MAAAHRGVLVRMRDGDAGGVLFSAGHDKVVEAAVILLEYGGVPKFLKRHGFGPGARNARNELNAWRAAGGRPR
jgi:hypothetical protein